MESSALYPGLNFYGHMVAFDCIIQDLKLILKKTEEIEFPDHSTEDGLIDDIFPDITRRSFVVTLLIGLEDQFKTFCGILRSASKQLLKWNDLKGSALDRFLSYCEKVCCLPVVSDPIKKQNIKGLIEVRNCIVHNNSTLDDFPNAKEILKFFKTVKGLSVNNGRIVLNYDGCINCADIVHGFMDSAYEAALKRYAKK